MRRPRLPFLLKSLVAVILAAMVALGVWRFHSPEQSNAHLASRAAEEKSQPEKSTVLLRAETRQTNSGPMIQLHWDPSAEPIRRSSYGILYIYDGGVPTQVVLRRRALDSGSTRYSPATDEVTFHLVLERGRSGGESMLVLLGARDGGRSGLESER